MLFPQFQSRFISSQNVVFAFWVTEFLSSVLCCLHFPKGFRFLVFIWLLNTGCPAHFFVVLAQFQGRSPSILCNVINIDTQFLGAHFPKSERQFLGAFPHFHLGALLFAFWPSHLKRSCTFLQMTHLQGTMIVHFLKFLKPSVMPFLLQDSEKGCHHRSLGSPAT